MALVLGINIHHDNEVYVGNSLVTIDQILSFNKTKITVHGAGMDNVFIINTNHEVEILPQVKAKLGKDTNRGGLVRLMIDAPKNIKIERGSRVNASAN